MDIMKVIKEHGMTQAQVAHAIGMHPKTLSNTIAPDRNLTVNSLRKIANAIGCSVADFFADEVSQPSDSTPVVEDAGLPTVTCPHCGHEVRFSVTVE
ncbi:MAG: helix-turn-helix transcriptional regulator [Prevotella sp.]|nr:helix-turn-helix transcriptional regulator [Prevotella sp.]